MRYSDTKVILLSITGIIVAIYLILALISGAVTAQSKMTWCEWKNGSPYDKDASQTGNRWEPNPLTIGLTGKCYVPGDKGVSK